MTFQKNQQKRLMWQQAPKLLHQTGLAWCAGSALGSGILKSVCIEWFLNDFPPEIGGSSRVLSLDLAFQDLVELCMELHDYPTWQTYAQAFCARGAERAWMQRHYPL